jgi:hypothetical protein
MDDPAGTTKNNLEVIPVWMAALPKPARNEVATKKEQILPDIRTGYSRGFQMAAYRSYDIMANRKHSVPRKEPKKKNWAAHPLSEMTFFSVMRFTSILGVTEEE